MYFPYLRGKQFELIALRELSGLLATNKLKISPIIEPIKLSTTLKSTIEDLKTKDLNFSVIINPKVGDLKNKTNDILAFLGKEIKGYDNFQLGIILAGKDNHLAIVNSIKKIISQKTSLTLIHNECFDNIQEIVDDYSKESIIKFNVVHLGNTTRRYYRNFDKNSVVELDDYFSNQLKNADYKNVDESDFSEEHLYYKEEGYIGFSDFLTIGDNYSESGFLPYAVAIHLSYPNDHNKIKVKHFVSDSNDDTSDVAGKFEEALDKLIKWCNKKKINTQSSDVFRELHNSGHFPGLGTIKKLSIMNHIEVVLRLI